VLLSLAAALSVGAGVAHANCPASDPNCMGGGGSDTPPATSAPPQDNSSSTHSQSNTQQPSGPQVQLQTPHEQPKYTPPVQKKVYTPKYTPASPEVSGSSFTPVLTDAPPAEIPTPGPAVALDGVEVPTGAGTASAAGPPPPPKDKGGSSPLLPAVLLVGAGLVALGALGAAQGPPLDQYADAGVSDMPTPTPTPAAPKFSQRPRSLFGKIWQAIFGAPSPPPTPTPTPTPSPTPDPDGPYQTSPTSPKIGSN